MYKVTINGKSPAAAGERFEESEEKEVKAMSYTLDLLKQLADGLARQFGPDCEIVIHDLEKHDLEHSIVHINNGHVTNRQEGTDLQK